MHQPWEQEPRGHWTQMWVHPQVREDLRSRRLQEAVLLGTEGTQRPEAGLWGLKDPALLLGSQQGPRADRGGSALGFGRTAGGALCLEPESEQWRVGERTEEIE